MPITLSSASLPVFRTALRNLDHCLAKAEANGGRVLMAKAPISDTSWWAIFEDPFGNHIGLYEGVTET